MNLTENRQIKANRADSIPKISLRLFFVICLVSGWLLLLLKSQDGVAAPGAGRRDFDLTNAIIPQEEIVSGGVPRDAIPSIDKPKFVSANAATFLHDSDPVVSVTIGNETRAYPLRILLWHEIVNDTIGREPIAVTYCPLCGTAMVFNRQIGARALTFGVSGLLYQSDVLLYDRQTQSLWSQLAMKSVAGPFVNSALPWLPSEQMTWREWQQKYPVGKVLSTQTGHARNYNATPYGAYENSPDVMFPVPAYRKELPRKAWVLGTIIHGEAKAYPLDILPAKESIFDIVGGMEIHIIFDPINRTATVTDNAGLTIPAVMVYWFAWQAFYPQTGLWKP